MSWPRTWGFQNPVPEVWAITSPTIQPVMDAMKKAPREIRAITSTTIQPMATTCMPHSSE